MSTKLYPPQIAGALPAFCKTYDILQDLSIGAKITIPFIMNAGVGEAEVKGFAMRLKTASSNTYICPVLYSTNWDKEKSTVTFELGEEYANTLQEGQFYKVQIAYYNYKTQSFYNTTTGKYEEVVIDATSSDNFIIGYYSTVGIIKCICKPKVFIEGYSSDSVNLFTGTFLGIYDQTNSSDKTEKVYSYRFDFYDIDDNIAHTSGEIIHNINNDSEYDYSTDRYICNDFIQPTEVYKLVYTVTTMNNYVISSPRYKVTANTRLAPGRLMEIVAIPIAEDGCIDVSCKGELALNAEGKKDEALYYGEFVLTRASEEDGFVEWEQIQEFRLSNQKPSTFHFYDFSVKQGIKYVYSVQQFNMSKLYSTRILSPQVSVDFEDMFLFDGERSLKIRFNPKVSSFKTTHLEKKVETIGSKYPFIFRNGAVGYKEFPIEGLISYHIDDNRRFLTREELYDSYRMNEERRNKDLSYKYIENHRGTDLTEENVLVERKFKMAVLDWLNNGEPKLFKSAAEGNFIVRLINISLTPEDTLGRMLHTFKSTAVEVADCTLANLKKYGFAIGGAINTFVPLWRTYNFTSLDDSSDGRGKILTFDQEVSSFKIEGVLPRTKVYIYYNDSNIPEEVIIGATGAYSFSGSDRKVIKLLFTFENNLNIQGHIECEYIGRRYSNFDAITGISLRTIISNQTIGINPQMEDVKRSTLDNINFELAVKALIDTNYRTLFNNYLFHPYIEKILNGERISSYKGMKDEWKDFLIKIDLLDEKTGQTKKDTSFNPADIIQYIKTDFYNYERSKLAILNMEQAKIRQRELIPVYVVPYEMITPEAWRKVPNIIYRSKNGSSANSDIICEKETYIDIDGSVKYKDYLSRENYERNDFPTWNLLFSTTPFGRPYPIDELITNLTLQTKKYEPMIDKHFVYVIYKYNANTGEWRLIENANYIEPVFYGSYYDPYQKELLTSYDTTFYINERYRYDPITIKDIETRSGFNFLKANGMFLTNTNLYIKEGNEYFLAKDKIDYPNKYAFWIKANEPEQYYLKNENNIDIKYSKEMTFNQLGEVYSFGTSSGIITESTFQLQIMDYYTEVNDMLTAQAKERYQKQYKFLNDVFKMFDNIEQADMKQYKFEALFEMYNTLLAGCEENNNPLDAYDYLIMFIMLEKKAISIKNLEKYFLPRLDGPTAPESDDIKRNLKLLIEEYRYYGEIPVEILLQELFYTENPIFAAEYSNRKNLFMIIYNQINKYGELQLIDTEEEDLLSLLTDDKITGLEPKYLSLQKLYDLIKAEIDKKLEELKNLGEEFQKTQIAVKESYQKYNGILGKIAAVEWIKRLRVLNPDIDLLDFLTTLEYEYALLAESINIESQYEQDQINKWKGFYQNNYDNLQSLVAENIVLNKIQNDNNEDKDLDSYIQKSIDENLKQMLLLASQMEIIENTVYNNVTDIITDEEVEQKYLKRSIDQAETLKYIYDDFILPKIQNLNNDIIAGIKNIEDTIDSSNTKLINTIKEFVLEVDLYELLLNFKNFGNTIIFDNISTNPDWREIRDGYIDMLPILEVEKLERYILKINTAGDIIDSDLEKNNEEPWYLFTKETNMMEYRSRLKLVLDFTRVLLENVEVSENLNDIIDATSLSADQLKNLPSLIYGSQVEDINKKIEDINIIIVKYIGLLKNSDKITSNNAQKWNELIADFDALYPFDSYVQAEPLSPINYQDKIYNAIKIETSVYDTIYDIEELVERESSGTAYQYKLRGEVVLPYSGEVNELTFTATYRYFSDYYQKLIGEINDGSGIGMLWWYLDIVLRGEIEYQESVLAEMQILLEEYSKKISNYSDKRNRYQQMYLEAKKIFDQYRIEYPDVFNYYFSSAGDQYELIDRAIADTKKYWNLFILELDLGYKREVERGMYG